MEKQQKFVQGTPDESKPKTRRNDPFAYQHCKILTYLNHHKGYDGSLLSLAASPSAASDLPAAGTNVVRGKGKASTEDSHLVASRNKGKGKAPLLEEGCSHRPSKQPPLEGRNSGLMVDVRRAYHPHRDPAHQALPESVGWHLIVRHKK
jgi:hypothetical protein